VKLDSLREEVYIFNDNVVSGRSTILSTPLNSSTNISVSLCRGSLTLEHFNLGNMRTFMSRCIYCYFHCDYLWFSLLYLVPSTTLVLYLLSLVPSSLSGFFFFLWFPLLSLLPSISLVLYFLSFPLLSLVSSTLYLLSLLCVSLYSLWFHLLSLVLSTLFGLLYFRLFPLLSFVPCTNSDSLFFLWFSPLSLVPFTLFGFP